MDKLLVPSYVFSINHIPSKMSLESRLEISSNFFTRQSLLMKLGSFKHAVFALAASAVCFLALKERRADIFGDGLARANASTMIWKSQK